MIAPAGAIVGLYYDGGVPVAVGDAIVTRSGRAYLVVEARRQERGKHVGRWHLRCEVLEDTPGEGFAARVHPLRWYKRAKKRVNDGWT